MHISFDVLDYPAPCLVLTVEGRIEVANAWAESLLGLSLVELRGQYWYTLASLAQQPELQNQWLHFCQATHSQLEVSFAVWPDIRRRTEVLFRIRRLAQGYLAVCEDRTELVQMRHSATALSEKLSALFRSSNQSIFMLDPQHRIIEFNYLAAMESREHFFRELRPGDDFLNYVQPDRYADFYASFQQALDGQTVFKERIITAADGNQFSFEMSYTPIRDAENQITGVCFTGLNTEAGKQMQRLLRDERTFVSAILDTSSALILVLDRKGRIVRFNKACETLCEYRAAEVYEHGFEVLIPEPQRADVWKSLKNIPISSFPLSLCLPLETRTHQHRMISWTATVLLNVEGTAEYYVATGIDITEAEEAARKLREQEELLRQIQRLDAVGRLTGEIAHDFNNILAGIQGYAELLEETLVQGGEPAGHIFEIKRICAKARSLTEQLLIFSRKRRPAPRPIELDSLLEQIQPLFLPLLGEHLTLQTQVEADLPRVLAEPTHLEQLLINLIVNARDAMQRKGVIQLAVCCRRESQAQFFPLFGSRPAGDYLCVSVRDQGPGIDPEVLEKMFTPFFTTKTEGTGLGLAIVYGIVKQYGGFVEVETRAGQGTCFRICLPAEVNRERLSVPLILACDLSPEELALVARLTEANVLPLDEHSLRQACEQEMPLRIVSVLMRPALERIHALLSQWSASSGVQVLYLSDPEGDLALLDELQPHEDALIRPLDRFRLHKWLNSASLALRKL